MSRWSNLYENHAFKQKWKALGDLIKEDFLPDNPEEAAVAEIARLRKAYEYVDASLQATDPELLSKGILNEMNGAAEPAFNETNTYKANKQIGHLQNANSQMDALLNISQRLPIPLQSKLKNSLPGIVTAYSKELDQHLNHMRSEASKRIESFEKEAEKTAKNYAELLQKLDVLKTQLSTVEQTIQQQTAEFNGQFQTSQQERKTQFETEKKTKITELQKLIDSTNESFQKLVQGLNTKVDEEFKVLATKSAKIIEIMQSQQENAEQVLGVVINTAQAGAYKSYANEERSTANIFRFLALILMILGVAVIAGPEIAKMFQGLAEYTVDWQKVLWRLPVSVIMFVPAFYLARESDKHRKNEFFNRRRELILCSVDPYLALLEKEKRDELKSEIAKDLFKDSHNIELPAKNVDLAELLAQVANFVKQVK